jgi:hypothetical protein
VKFDLFKILRSGPAGSRNLENEPWSICCFEID